MCVFQITMFKAPPCPPQLYVCACMYVNTPVYRNGRLCPNLEAISYEVSEIFSGSTASQRDIDSVPMYDHSLIHVERCVKISKQSAQQFLSFNVRNSFAFTFLLI
jgi:hypothetical protein